MPSQCTNNTFCYLTDSSTASNMGTCLGGCDVVTQNCTAANTQCNYGPDAGRDCFPDGTLNEGDPCGVGVSMGCKKGTTCVSKNESDGGITSSCAKFCRVTSDCVNNRICSTGLSIPGSVEHPIVCQPAPASCDLLLQNCPTSTDGCFPSSATASSCFPAGSVANGGICQYANSCMRGSLCISQTDGGNFCRAICNSGDGGAPTCVTGTCNPLSSKPGVGACN
jgi:hypothetical protein